MALTSPGVQVTVIDESFYTPAEPGTTPLIVVATAQDKSNAAGTGTAAATTKANAGVAYRLTSQKDLVDLFGVPFFERTASGSPVHGGERNEYGLLAAYSLLGVSNAAFIVRADIDLDQLEAQADAPGANPNNGAWWIDTQATAWGIQEWNGSAATTTGGQKFTAKSPIVFCRPDNPFADSPVTCCNLTNSLSKSIKALTPLLTAFVNPTIIPAEMLKAAKRRTAKADCLPNSSI